MMRDSDECGANIDFSFNREQNVHEDWRFYVVCLYTVCNEIAGYLGLYTFLLWQTLGRTISGVG